MHEYVLWVVVAVASMHVAEEFGGNWVDWAKASLHLEVDWPTFYITNAMMIVVLAAGAMIGWQAPALSLAGPALIAINAIFFHIGISLVQRRWSPGTLTATLLYLQVSIWAYASADSAGVLDGETLAGSLVLGALLMAFPIVLIKLKPTITKAEKLTNNFD